MESAGQRPTFGVADYCVFGGTLFCSLMIGVFYAFRGKHTNEELLLGNRQMWVLPVTISIMASFLSAILIIGVPAEIFMNGAEFWVSTTAYTIIMPVVAIMFIPIFYNCRVTSIFEYIQLRFESPLLRGVTVAATLLQTTIYMALALYAPALALSSTTPLTLETSIVGTAAVGILYTTFGGLKAVVWADVLQACIMAAGMVAIIVQGAINVGGFTDIFSICAKHGRINLFNFNVNIWERHNFWNLFFGSFFASIAVTGIAQAAVQRYNSLPTLKAAQRCCFLLMPGYFTFISLACLCGLAIFANYAECDPIKQGVIERKDQLVPYFVLDQMSYLTGLPGLFVACIMSGALSTISSGLNSLAAITWKDFIGNLKMFKNLPEEKQSWVIRAISFLYGCVSVGLAFVASKLGGILQATMSILSAFGGPLLGVFTLGIFVPFANGKGAVTGFLTALAFSMWMSFGAFSTGKHPEPIPSSVAGCETNITSLVSSVTSTTAAPAEAIPHETEDPSVIEQYIYAVSYKLYSLVGCLLCVFVGSIISLMTGCNEHQISETLVNPTAFKIAGRYRRRRSTSDVKDGVPNLAFTMPTYIQSDDGGTENSGNSQKTT